MNVIIYCSISYLERSDEQITVKDPNYDTTEVLKISLPNTKLFDLSIKFMDDTQSSASIWAIDGMLIDEELLYAEDEDADRIY